jgi:tetratricopeptide (TPR) repeat protein
LVEAHLRLGKISQQRNQVDAAISRYEQALALQPEFVPLQVLIGNLYLDKGDLAKARSYYERALSINPDFAIAAGNLAWIYMKQGGRLDAAFQLAQKARQLLPELDSIADTLAWVEYKRGDYASALPLLQECVQKAPYRSSYRYHLGMVLIAKGEKERGRDELQEALRLKLMGEDANNAHQILAKLD